MKETTYTHAADWSQVQRPGDLDDVGRNIRALCGAVDARIQMFSFLWEARDAEFGYDCPACVALMDAGDAREWPRKG